MEHTIEHIRKCFALCADCPSERNINLLYENVLMALDNTYADGYEDGYDAGYNDGFGDGLDEN